MAKRLFEGGGYFKYFGQRGAIIRGRRLIERRLLFEEIRYVLRTWSKMKTISVDITIYFHHLTLSGEMHF